MPNARKGFFQPKTMFADNGDNPTTRILNIIPTITNNSETIVYTVSTNMPAGRYYFTIEGSQPSDFTDGERAGNVIIDGAGAGTFSKTLNVTANFSSGNANIYASINTDIGDELGTSANSRIRVANPFSATGGNTSVTAGYKLHTYDTVGNSSLTVLALDERPNANVNTFVVAGGGAGGGGAALGSDFLSGGGGGGGGVLNANTVSSAFSLTSYGLSVGDGGANGNVYVGAVTVHGTSGANSVFSGPSTQTAIGGGRGASFYSNGLSIDSLQAEPGGSGGGGSDPTYPIGGAPTVNQGNYGGNVSTNADAGAGGGGAGGLGITPPATGNVRLSQGGAGGPGIPGPVVGSNVLYGAGGGGGQSWTYAVGTGAEDLVPGGAGGSGNQLSNTSNAIGPPISGKSLQTLDGNYAGGLGGAGSTMGGDMTGNYDMANLPFTSGYNWANSGHWAYGFGSGGGGGGADSLTGDESRSQGGSGAPGIVMVQYLYEYRLFDTG